MEGNITASPVIQLSHHTHNGSKAAERCSNGTFLQANSCVTLNVKVMIQFYA